jgi:hypothetical protein
VKGDTGASTPTICGSSIIETTSAVEKVFISKQRTLFYEGIDYADLAGLYIWNQEPYPTHLLSGAGKALYLSIAVSQ